MKRRLARSPWAGIMTGSGLGMLERSPGMMIAAGPTLMGRSGWAAAMGNDTIANAHRRMIFSPGIQQSAQWAGRLMSATLANMEDVTRTPLEQQAKP